MSHLRQKLTFLFFTAFWLLGSLANAQFFLPGEVDTTFGFGKPHRFFDNQANPRPGVGFSDEVRSLAIQPDGKLIIGGIFSSYNGFYRSGLVRIEADGQHDSTFNTGSGLNGGVNAILVQADGKVLIVGTFTSFNGNSCSRIVRLHANGSIDVSFQSGSGADDAIKCVVRQPDGKYLIGGNFTQYNGIARPRIARIHANGSLDTSFDPGIGANELVNQIELQPNGKIMLVGFFSQYNGLSQQRIARLHSNGLLDTSFSSGLQDFTEIKSVLVQPDGKLMICGTFSYYGGVLRQGIARLNPNGSLDPSFNPGLGFNGNIVCMISQADGKLIIGGDISFINMVNWGRIVRLNVNGSIDTTFDSRNGFFGSWVNCVVIQPDGKVVAGGKFESYRQVHRRNIARLNTNGSPDFDFNPGVGASAGGSLPNPQVYAIAIDVNDKILVGGNFTNFNDRPAKNLIRLHGDGSTDTSFSIGTGPSSSINCLLIQPDGKILIAGYFTSYNGFARNYITRLNSNGSIDTTFGHRLGANGNIKAMVLQTDGKIIIAGNFMSYDGVPRNKIARINPDGSVDSTFIIGTGANGDITMLALQRDGRILIGGFFTSFNGTPRNRIARLNPVGSLDVSFVVGTGTNGAVHAAVVRPNGKIVIGGEFTQYNGTPRSIIAHLNTNGSLDSSLSNVPWGSGVIRSMLLLPNGVLVASGGFGTFGGTNLRNVVRFLEDGSLDSTFVNGTGANGNINVTAFQPDGKLVVGGAFNTFNGLYRTQIARIFSPSCVSLISNTTSNSSICAGDTKQLQGTAGGTWILAAGQGTINGTTYISPLNATGSISIYNELDGCHSPLVTFSLIDAPRLSINQIGDTLIGSQVVGNYQWYYNSVAIPGANSHFWLPRQSGIYTLKVTNTQGCTGISNAINVIMANVYDVQKTQFSWSTYPVPFSELLHITAEQPFSFTLLDLQGAVLLRGNSDEMEVRLSTAHLASGVYVMKLVLNGQTAYRKIVKH